MMISNVELAMNCAAIAIAICGFGRAIHDGRLFTNPELDCLRLMAIVWGLCAIAVQQGAIVSLSFVGLMLMVDKVRQPPDDGQDGG
ncbi:hypothetical protein NUV26_30135 [Burkholderia pseudomultivorans]|uniref:hypothetical protein n=1 Tax=Burkholderia pseudomultivorans TaxID=1207504 RepID=UPI002875AEB3|nr:hypothetical protein [Burkholderia pseudomultivorans]MDS0796438.1 hypothetical protein [Burkholderia pseudomultivorans]